MITVPGQTQMHIGPVLDKRTLTNAQRLEMGLSPRGHGGKRGPGRICDPYALNFQRRAEVFDTPPQQRLADQIEAMLKKWADRGIS